MFLALPFLFRSQYVTSYSFTTFCFLNLPPFSFHTLHSFFSSFFSLFFLLFFSFFSLLSSIVFLFFFSYSRLVNDSTLTPPWCVAVRTLGHTFQQGKRTLYPTFSKSRWDIVKIAVSYMIRNSLQKTLPARLNFYQIDIVSQSVARITCHDKIH